MSKEILQSKTCKELRELAKERNISGRWDMTKPQLIEAILGTEVVGEPVKNESVKDEVKIDNLEESGVDVEAKEKESASTEIDMQQKLQYVENIAIGTIVAFRLSNGKVKSAKVAKKSTKNRKLKLETDYGAEYIVNYEDIVWVRTGKRWPKGVYKLLKGLVDDDGKKEQVEA